MKNFLLSFLMILTFGLQPHATAFQAAVIDYYSPVSGARYIPARTTITFRFTQKLDASTLVQISIRVQGTASGDHTGKLVLSDDEKTVIFKPGAPFTPSELVRVDVCWASPTASIPNILLSFSFSISSQSSSITQPFDLINGLTHSKQPTPSSIVPSSPHAPYLSTPSDFPVINVTTPANGTDDGDLFLSNFDTALNTHNYLLILDNNGEPVYYQKVPDGFFSTDFKKLPNGNLAYWDGKSGSFIILDDTYHIIDTILPGNGYARVDAHELVQLSNGHYLFLIYDNQTVDMSVIVPDGSPQATVTGAVIQELDAQKNVVFQWRSWDHFAITDTYESLTSNPLDYVHANAIDLDIFGNIYLSSRHMSEITKIDHQTGAILWRLGGRNNQFTFARSGSVSPTEDPTFAYQHNIRVLPNGHLSLFDNHNNNVAPVFARALEFMLDTGSTTATLVKVIHNTPDVYSLFAGNVQHLINGNILIGWGGNYSPTLTEFKPDGSKAIELTVGTNNFSYRGFRFPWHGYPTWAPTLLTRDDGTGGMNLTISWNGATDVASYQVYGSDAQPITTPIVQGPKTGFETTIHIANAQTQPCLLWVMPLDAPGNFTQFSNMAYNPACLNTSFLPIIAAQ